MDSLYFFYLDGTSFNYYLNFIYRSSNNNRNKISQLLFNFLFSHFIGVIPGLRYKIVGSLSLEPAKQRCEVKF